jgi:hypothetical protein
VKIRRTIVQRQPGQKVSKTPISTNKNLGMVAPACPPSYMGSVNRIKVWAGLSVTVRPYFKKQKGALQLHLFFPDTQLSHGKIPGKPKLRDNLQILDQYSKPSRS